VKDMSYICEGDESIINVSEDFQGLSITNDDRFPETCQNKLARLIHQNMPSPFRAASGPRPTALGHASAGPPFPPQPGFIRVIQAE
jgi:hypothetical protein